MLANWFLRGAAMSRLISRSGTADAEAAVEKKWTRVKCFSVIWKAGGSAALRLAVHEGGTWVRRVINLGARRKYSGPRKKDCLPGGEKKVGSLASVADVEWWQLQQGSRARKGWNGTRDGCTLHHALGVKPRLGLGLVFIYAQKLAGLLWLRKECLISSPWGVSGT